MASAGAKAAQRQRRMRGLAARGLEADLSSSHLTSKCFLPFRDSLFIALSSCKEGVAKAFSGGSPETSPHVGAVRFKGCHSA